MHEIIDTLQVTAMTAIATYFQTSTVLTQPLGISRRKYRTVFNSVLKT